MSDAPTMISSRPINITIAEKKELYKCYMPFVQGGALYIPLADFDFQIGQKVFIILTLPNEKTKKTISGKIIWINKTTQNKGFGVTLGEGTQAKALKDLIETIIVDTPNKNELVTYTI